jgi:hypothetical protein
MSYKAGAYYTCAKHGRNFHEDEAMCDMCRQEAELTALRTRLEEAESILRKLEWSQTYSYCTGWPCCPVCKRIKPGHGADRFGNLPVNSGHHKDCKLANILTPPRKEG